MRTGDLALREDHHRCGRDEQQLDHPRLGEGDVGLRLADDADANIQVVVRCRGRSDREASEGSPVVVNIEGPLSKEVLIRTEAAKMDLGVVIPPTTKTYSFDRVFGFVADQAVVYKEVVAPILDQVLSGYNCTLFAYGQTGTGKTYVKLFN